MSPVFVVFEAILLFVLAVATSSGGYWTTQKSVHNNKTADLALDADPLSCAETGFDSEGWWTVDLGKPESIRGFKLMGSSAPFQIRIGNESEALGLRTPPSTNALCLLSLGVELTQTLLDMPCRNEITGRYVDMVVVDPVSSRQLRLCDLKIQFA